MRQFWLSKSGSTDIIDLMEKTAFASDPSGLGASIESTDYAIGTDIIETNKSVKYDPVSFNVVFGYGSDPYDAMTRFIKSINSASLKLYYYMGQNELNLYAKRKAAGIKVDAPTGEIESPIYCKDVAFSSLSKSEVDKSTGALTSELQLKQLSPWYTWEPFPAHDAKDGFNLAFSTADVVHLMDGLTVPIKLDWYCSRNQIPTSSGYLYLEIVDQDGKSYGKIIFETVIEAGYTVSINSDYKELTAVATKTGASTINLMNYVTSDTTGFLRAPVLPNKTLYLRSNSGNTWDDSQSKAYYRKEMIVV